MSRQQVSGYSFLPSEQGRVVSERDSAAREPLGIIERFQDIACWQLCQNAAEGAFAARR